MRDREHRGTPARPGAAEGDEAAGTDGAALERVQLQRLTQRKATRERAEPARIPEGAGQPLGGDVRGRMEGQLGADLSGVRVHTGADSATAADRLGARAFTVENDVHLAAGAYAPGTKDRDQLLAHELTHVVQGQSAGVQRKAEGDDAGGAAAVSQPETSTRASSAPPRSCTSSTRRTSCGTPATRRRWRSAPATRRSTPSARRSTLQQQLMHEKLGFSLVDHTFSRK